MKRVMIAVPLLFLCGLVYLAYGMYRGTESQVPCTGDACDRLTEQQLIDLALEANAQ